MNQIHVKTLGCKVNTFDAHAIENKFKALGWQLTNEVKNATISVVNTCSVTENADKEARYLARRFKRENPDTLVVMTGCYAQTDSARLSEMSEVDVIIPNESKEQITDFILEQLEARKNGTAVQRLPSGAKLVTGNKQSHFKSALTFFDQADSTQTRAFVKIQDGCNGFCTYCLIPYARGASRSVPEEAALSEIARLIGLGTKEIVLTGIHIGDYGMDLPLAAKSELPFVEFMKRVFDLAGDFRIRISSLEPAELTKELAEVLFQNKEKVCDHFHLPLQSGSDEILKKMRRTYDKARYKESCELVRHYFPDACIGADVIPGFPSETDEQFQETIEFIKEVGLNYLHVFPYSLRPNTAAAKMPGHLEAAVIKERAAILRKLSVELKHQYLSQFVGKPLEILWEKDFDDQNRPIGISRNYINVVAPSRELWNLAGKVSLMKAKGFTAGTDRMLSVQLN